MGFGEASQALHTLVHGLAESRALHVSCTSAEPTTAGVFSQILGSYRRILSCCCVWSQENCLLQRMGHLDEGARQAAARRTEAVREEEWSRRETQALHQACVKGRARKLVGQL